jgi:nucleotide-binding universal stress UspA family protein
LIHYTPEITMKTFKKILVPVDFSAHSREAVTTAIKLADRFGASIKMVHVFQPVEYGVEGSLLYSAEQLNRVCARLEKDLEIETQAAQASAGAVPVSGVVLHGIISSEIVRCAKEENFDLIVMGTHGRTGFKHLMLGSVAEKVLRTAACPVLTVRAESEAARAAA